MFAVFLIRNRSIPFAVRLFAGCLEGLMSKPPVCSAPANVSDSRNTNVRSLKSLNGRLTFSRIQIPTGKQDDHPAAATSGPVIFHVSHMPGPVLVYIRNVGIWTIFDVLKRILLSQVYLEFFFMTKGSPGLRI